MAPGLPHFLLVGAVLFALGTYTVITRTNAVGILMGVELILNAANVNFLAFWRYGHMVRNEGPLTGVALAVFVITIAAAEVCVALAVVLAVFRLRGDIDLTRRAE